MTRSLPAAALALLGLAASCAGPEASRRAASTPRTFAVPDHGALTLSLPAGWKVKETGTAEPLPLALEVTPADGKFVLVLTPVWDPDAPQEPAEAEMAQALAEHARREALKGSVEKEIALEELVGDGVHGYWFTATDRTLVGKKAGRGEWKALVQGAAAVGDLLVVFEMLDDGPGPHRKTVLDLIRSARHAPGEGDGAAPAPERAPPSEPAPPPVPDPTPRGEAPPAPAPGNDEPLRADPSIDTVPLTVTVPGARWSILVDLPGFQAASPRTGDDGASFAVLALNPSSGVVASLLLTRAGDGVAGAVGCRERDLPRIRKAVPDLTSLRAWEAGGAARVEYLAPTLGEQRVAQWNTHAWREREGWCVQLHLSKMGHEAGDHEGLEAIVGTLRFGEAM